MCLKCIYIYFTSLQPHPQAGPVHPTAPSLQWVQQGAGQCCRVAALGMSLSVSIPAALFAPALPPLHSPQHWYLIPVVKQMINSEWAASLLDAISKSLLFIFPGKVFCGRDIIILKCLEPPASAIPSCAWVTPALAPAFFKRFSFSYHAYSFPGVKINTEGKGLVNK